MPESVVVSENTDPTTDNRGRFAAWIALVAAAGVVAALILLVVRNVTALLAALAALLVMGAAGWIAVTRRGTARRVGVVMRRRGAHRCRGRVDPARRPRRARHTRRRRRRLRWREPAGACRRGYSRAVGSRRVCRPCGRCRASAQGRAPDEPEIGWRQGREIRPCQRGAPAGDRAHPAGARATTCGRSRRRPPGPQR